MFPLTTPALVEALVHTLLELEKPFPFIFALGSILATLPKELIERVHASGRGLICEFWVEQRAILQHDAVGWFLTHGGFKYVISVCWRTPRCLGFNLLAIFSSLSESLSQGIPLIVWPLAAEQPVNAALLSTGANAVAIELMQVRLSVNSYLITGQLLTGADGTTTRAFPARGCENHWDCGRRDKGIPRRV
jgi:hypothetical protein